MGSNKKTKNKNLQCVNPNLQGLRGKELKDWFTSATRRLQSKQEFAKLKAQEARFSSYHSMVWKWQAMDEWNSDTLMFQGELALMRENMKKQQVKKVVQ